MHVCAFTPRLEQYHDVIKAERHIFPTSTAFSSIRRFSSGTDTRRVSPFVGCHSVSLCFVISRPSFPSLSHYHVESCWYLWLASVPQSLLIQHLDVMTATKQASLGLYALQICISQSRVFPTSILRFLCSERNSMFQVSTSLSISQTNVPDCCCLPFGQCRNAFVQSTCVIAHSPWIMTWIFEAE